MPVAKRSQSLVNNYYASPHLAESKLEETSSAEIVKPTDLGSVSSDFIPMNMKLSCQMIIL